MKMPYSESYKRPVSFRLTEQYVSPYKSSTDATAAQRFEDDLKSNIVNVDAFHRAYDKELDALGLLDPQPMAYNGHPFTADYLFSDDGTLNGKKSCGAIKPYATKYGRNSQAVKALIGMWACIYGQNYKNYTTNKPNVGVYKNLVPSHSATPNNQPTAAPAAHSDVIDEIKTKLTATDDFKYLDELLKRRPDIFGSTSFWDSVLLPQLMQLNERTTLTQNVVVAWCLYEMFLAVAVYNFYKIYATKAFIHLSQSDFVGLYRIDVLNQGNYDQDRLYIKVRTVHRLDYNKFSIDNYDFKILSLSYEQFSRASFDIDQNINYLEIPIVVVGDVTQKAMSIKIKDLNSTDASQWFNRIIDY